MSGWTPLERATKITKNDDEHVTDVLRYIRDILTENRTDNSKSLLACTWIFELSNNQLQKRAEHLQLHARPLHPHTQLPYLAEIFVVSTSPTSPPRPLSMAA